MAECSAAIQYAGGPKFMCTLPGGHKGPHGGAGVVWTCSIAVIQPRKW
jgi:hypothetical protein